jgi:hypothetical protein
MNSVPALTPTHKLIVIMAMFVVCFSGLATPRLAAQVTICAGSQGNNGVYNAVCGSNNSIGILAHQHSSTPGAPS